MNAALQASATGAKPSKGVLVVHSPERIQTLAQRNQIDLKKPSSQTRPLQWHVQGAPPASKTTTLPPSQTTALASAGSGAAQPLLCTLCILLHGAQALLRWHTRRAAHANISLARLPHSKFPSAHSAAASGHWLPAQG